MRHSTFELLLVSYSTVWCRVSFLGLDGKGNRRHRLGEVFGEGIRSVVGRGCRTWNKGRKQVATFTYVVWVRTALTSSPLEFALMPSVKGDFLVSSHFFLLAGRDLNIYIYIFFNSSDSSSRFLDVVPFPSQDESLSLCPPPPPTSRIVPGSRTQWILPDKRPC